MFKYFAIVSELDLTPGGGYSHVKTYGDVPQFWVGFCKKFQNMGPIFHEKIPNYWSNLKIWCVFMAKTQEMGTILRKILKYGCLFLEKLPLNMDMVLSCRLHIPDQSKSDSPTPSI